MRTIYVLTRIQLASLLECEVVTIGMIQEHENALSSANTLYHEFLLAYKEHKQEVYGFVEGKEDPMYYAGLAENRMPSGWSVRLVHSSGKKKVLEVYDLIDWARFNTRRICFFVDRDLSEFTGEHVPSRDNIYVTDAYSIENQIATPALLIRVLKEVFGLIDLSEREEQKIVQEYSGALEVFTEELVPIMSQIIVWRKKSSRACLDNIKMNDIFEVSHGTITVREQLRGVSEKLSYIAQETNETIADSGILREVEAEFRNSNGKKLFIRGKYILWLFLEFAKMIHEQAERYCAKIQKKPKVRVPIGIGNAMIVLAPRARIPDTLASFIDRNFLSYISNNSVQGSFA